MPMESETCGPRRSSSVNLAPPAFPQATGRGETSPVAVQFPPKCANRTTSPAPSQFARAPVPADLGHAAGAVAGDGSRGKSGRSLHAENDHDHQRLYIGAWSFGRSTTIGRCFGRLVVHGHLFSSTPSENQAQVRQLVECLPGRSSPSATLRTKPGCSMFTPLVAGVQNSSCFGPASRVCSRLP